MNIRIENIELNTKSSRETKSRVKDAEARKKAVDETLEEAWERILAMKLSDTDRKRVLLVKKAMEEGKIGREPAKEGKRLGKFTKAEALRLYQVLKERMREEKLAELIANTPSNYVLITDEDELKRIVDVPFNVMPEPEIAVDTETTGLDVYIDVIVGVSLTFPNADIHYYIPFKPTKDKRALPSEKIELLRPLIESEKIGKVLHNALFDMAMFARHGIHLENVIWDTQIAAHVLNENEREQHLGGVGSFKLKDLAPRYLKVEADTFDELFGKNFEFHSLPLEVALPYAAKDTHLTWDLYKFQKYHLQRFPSMYEYYTTVEVPLLYVIFDMERNGYILDMEFAKEYGEKLKSEANDLHAWLLAQLSPYHEGEEEINLNAPAQVRVAMEKLLGIEIPNMDSKRTLKPLRSKYEVVDNYLKWKKLVKLSGTYIDALPLKRHPVTGRWHSRFNPMGTVTGRFSSGKDKDADDEVETDFNVQNQPEEARAMFVAPEGKVLVSADFKSQEIRCVAYLSGEPVLIEAFKKGIDPYANMASKYYKRPYWEVNKNPDGTDTKERKSMKTGWLSILYGTSDKSLAEQLGTTVQNAKEFKRELFGSMSDLVDWIKGNEAFAKKHGFVWMDKEQRKRRLPQAKWKKKDIPYGEYWKPEHKDKRIHNSEISKAMRQATNARVQGSSAIQTKVTMIRAHEECKKREGWKLWATVHDELIFEIPEDFTKEDIEVIRDIMVNSYRWGDEIENGTDIEVMKVWGKSKPADVWLAEREAG